MARSCLALKLGVVGCHLPFEQGGFALLGICCDSVGNGDRWDVKWLSVKLTLKLSFKKLDLIPEYATA